LHHFLQQTKGNLGINVNVRHQQVGKVSWLGTIPINISHTLGKQAMFSSSFHHLWLLNFCQNIAGIVLRRSCQILMVLSLQSSSQYKNKMQMDYQKNLYTLKPGTPNPPKLAARLTIAIAPNGLHPKYPAAMRNAAGTN